MAGEPCTINLRFVLGEESMQRPIERLSCMMQSKALFESLHDRVSRADIEEIVRSNMGRVRETIDGARTKDRDTQIHNLKIQLEESQSTIKQLDEKLKAEQRKRALFNKRIAELRVQLTTSTNQTGASQVKNLKQAMREAEQRHTQELKQKTLLLAAAQGKNATLESDKLNLTRRITKLQAKQRELTKTIAQQKQTITALQSESKSQTSGDDATSIEELEIELDKAKKIIELLLEQKKDLEKRLGIKKGAEQRAEMRTESLRDIVDP